MCIDRNDDEVVPLSVEAGVGVVVVRFSEFGRIATGATKLKKGRKNGAPACMRGGTCMTKGG